MKKRKTVQSLRKLCHKKVKMMRMLRTRNLTLMKKLMVQMKMKLIKMRLPLVVKMVQIQKKAQKMPSRKLKGKQLSRLY